MSIYDSFKDNGVPLNDDTSLLRLEDILVSKVLNKGFKISLDCSAEEGMVFTHVNYSIIANSLIVHPLSFKASDKYIVDVLLMDSQIQTHPYVFPKGTDKYVLDIINDVPEDLTDLVVLPGSNIMMTLVDKGKLERLAKMPGVYAKLHPLTTPDTAATVVGIFGEDRVLGVEKGLYSLMYAADTVWTTSASESLVYAIKAGKTVRLVDDNAGNNRISGYSFLTNTLATVDDKSKELLLDKILYSPISCIFSPADPMVETKIDNYVNYLTDKHTYYDVVL
jgi:hypothetical protein